MWIYFENMKCLVIVLVLMACLDAVYSAAASCVHSKDFFARYNVSADDNDGPGPVCGGQCCGRGTEQQLRKSLQRTIERRVSEVTRPIAELLISTQKTLREHLTRLSHQSQNKTAIFFARVYPKQATRAHTPLVNLYEDIRTLLRPTADGDDVTGNDLGTPPPRDLIASSRKFFRDVSPVVYHNVMKLDGKQFTAEYEVCLKDAYDAVQPFGDVPQQLGTTLSKSLEAARALLQVLAVGAAALTASEEVLSREHDSCSIKLLQIGACSQCRGHNARPCQNYCLNVARGCIGSLVAELDAPWTSYVEGVERLTRTDADAALRTLDEIMSKAIMHAIENHAVLEKKVTQECGPLATVNVSGLISPRPTPGAVRPDTLRAPPPDTELLQLAASLAASKKLFAALADRVCDDSDFADEDNEQCWNGVHIGQYTKPLVLTATVSDQKINPEMEGSLPQDPKVATVADRLLQARELLLESWGNSLPNAEAFMQGDEAGEEGSGSGTTYHDDDDVDDTEGSGEEGSGSEDISGRSGIIRQGTVPDSTTPTTGTATVSRPLLSLVSSLALILLASRCLT